MATALDPDVRRPVRDTSGARRARHGLIVEMIGAPGAGKSTLLPVVIAAAEAAGLRAHAGNDAARAMARRTLPGRACSAWLPPPWDDRATWRVFATCRLLWASGHCLTHPRLARYLWRTQRRRPSASDAKVRRVVRWHLRTLGARQFLSGRSLPDEVLVFDEGLVHRVVQLHSSCVERPDKAEIRTYLDLIPPPDLVIHVTSSPQRCHQRVERRGRWARLAHRSTSETAEFVANAHRAVLLAAADARRHGWRLVEVANDGGALDGVAQRLYDTLVPIFDAHARALPPDTWMAAR